MDDKPTDGLHLDNEALAGLEVLGLQPLEAQVLLTVLTQEEVTNAALGAASGASPARVAAAVDSLVRHGLLDRVTSRRPHVTFLHARANAALDALLQLTETQRNKQQEQLDRAIEAVAVAVRRREERGRPAAEHYGRSPELRGRTGHDEVLKAPPGRSSPPPLSLSGCPARLLLTNMRADFDLEAFAWWQEQGSELRLTTEALPPLRILDRSRLGTVAGTPIGQRMVWSWDARHVRAAQELFDIWWERARPGITKPYLPKKPEPEWDVEEWDPADL